MSFGTELFKFVTVAFMSIIHLTFVVSAFMLAYTDRLTVSAKARRSRSDIHAHPVIVSAQAN